MLYTKCIYSPKSKEDGLRVCVMAYLTGNDGETPVEELYKGQLFHQWNKILAPHPRTVGRWYGSEQTDEDWKVFTEKYLARLQKERVLTEAMHLAGRAMEEDITILCVEETHERCHRGLLAKVCKEIMPGLSIEHR